MRKRGKAAAIATVGTLGLVWVSVLVTDTRVLIHEKLVRPGEKDMVDGYGDVGISAQATLVCRYFNGRQVLAAVFWHSPNNLMGRDSCPFITRGG
jgi:hypothetical protein